VSGRARIILAALAGAVIVATAVGADRVGLGGILEFLGLTFGLALFTPYAVAWLAIAAGVVLGLLPAAASVVGIVALVVTAPREAS
jgi:hypothetical protein